MVGALHSIPVANMNSAIDDPFPDRVAHGPNIYRSENRSIDHMADNDRDRAGSTDPDREHTEMRVRPVKHQIHLGDHDKTGKSRREEREQHALKDRPRIDK